MLSLGVGFILPYPVPQDMGHRSPSQGRACSYLFLAQLHHTCTSGAPQRRCWDLAGRPFGLPQGAEDGSAADQRNSEKAKLPNWFICRSQDPIRLHQHTPALALTEQSRIYIFLQRDLIGKQKDGIRDPGVILGALWNLNADSASYQNRAVRLVQRTLQKDPGPIDPNWSQLPGHLQPGCYVGVPLHVYGHGDVANHPIMIFRMSACMGNGLQFGPWSVWWRNRGMGSMMGSGGC